jgi:hypothetical protein
MLYNNKMNNWGLNNTYDYYEFAIDSLDNSGSGSGGISALNWPSFYVGGKNPLTRVRGMKILSAEIPFSYYVFTDRNNSFELSSTGLGGWIKVVIPVGNYTKDSILPVLKGLIDAALTVTSTVTYNATTMKLNFDGGTYFFRFIEDVLASPRLWLGFNAGVTGGTGLFSAQNVALLSGPNYLYINSVQFGQLTANYLPTGNSSTNGNTGPQIAKVPVTCDSGEIIYYNDPDPQKYFDIGDSNTIQKIDFYLSIGTSEDVLDLNGLSFSLKLALLLEKMNMDESQSGMVNQDRVVKRMRPY